MGQKVTEELPSRSPALVSAGDAHAAHQPHAVQRNRTCPHPASQKRIGFSGGAVEGSVTVFHSAAGHTRTNTVFATLATGLFLKSKQSASNPSAKTPSYRHDPAQLSRRKNSPQAPSSHGLLLKWGRSRPTSSQAHEQRPPGQGIFLSPQMTK